MLISMLTALAIVTQDQAALRLSPRDSAPQQVALWQGDTVEVRGQRLDYLEVYDHRSEHGGYIRATQVKPLDLSAAQAPNLLAVVRLLRDAPGSEALGIAYAAAYLKAEADDTKTPEAWDAIGIMAERLADRASSRHRERDDAVRGAHIEGVEQVGVHFNHFTSNDWVRWCYDGDAYQQVLAHAASASDEQRARAALALTRSECIDPNLSAMAHEQFDQWRGEVLDAVPTQALPEWLKNRVQLRRAAVHATLAFGKQRHGESAFELANQALQTLAAINLAELTDEDQPAYQEAAMRVGAMRWAAVSPVPSTGVSLGATAKVAALGIQTHAGSSPGQTCVDLVDAQHDAAHPLLERCTYALVWPASVSVNAAGTALSLAAAPLDGWRELWLFKKSAEGWSLDVLPPSNDAPNSDASNLGYVEFAGWVPGASQMLAVREVRNGGRWKRTFETINLNSLQTERAADKPASLSAFYRWQSPVWKSMTVSLR